MTTFKTIAIGITLALCLYKSKATTETYTSSFENIHDFNIDGAKKIASKIHDWECKYIIQDGYHENVKFHYVNEIVVNVSGSISFVDEKNTHWTIPAPYYWIYVNPKS